jgi:small subunit ribosomal protein S3Ae
LPVCFFLELSPSEVRKINIYEKHYRRYLFERSRRNRLAKQQRGTTRKARDRWRAKNWYKVLAPDMFGGTEMAETLTDEPSKLIGRSLPISLMDLTGDFSKQHIKIKFRITTVRGDEALTVFTGHSLTSDYIRRLTRRKHSKMDGVYDVQTKDGYIIRIKPMAITEKRIQSSQERILRKITGDTIENFASTATLSELVKAIISGELAKNIFKKCKPIYPIKRVEVSKSQILKRVEGEEEIPGIFDKPEEELEVVEKPEEGADETPEIPAEDAVEEPTEEVPE